MGPDHLQIPIPSYDYASWKQKMEELKNMKFPSQDDEASQVVVHKDLAVGKAMMIYELYKAVDEGNVDNLVEVLKQQCIQSKLPLSDIFDKVSLAGDSLLHVAVDKGKDQIVELISDNFPELLIRRNVRGDTVLHVAVRSKKSTMVKLILSQYAIEKSKHVHGQMNDVTKETNEHEDTPLHEAIYSGDVDVIKEILDADKEVIHYLNKSRRSPLFLAFESGNEDILNLLLEVPFPADQPLPHCFGNSPLHAAILEHNHGIIGEIIRRRPELVYLSDEDGNTPLHFAAEIGYVAGCEVLLRKSSLLEQNKKGRLPIHLACKKGHVEVVEEFFKQARRINHFDLLNPKGQNILHIAAKNGKCKLVEYLLKKLKIGDSCTINQQDNDGNTPLHLASKYLFPSTVYFIARDTRTNVNLTNKQGLTARNIMVGTFKTLRMRERQVLCNVVLMETGVSVKVNKNHMLHSQRQAQPETDLIGKKEISERFLIVAALMVTVTFAAAFTVPGGVYSSDDSNPKLGGAAVLSHKPFFWVFTIFNMTAMFTSAMACVSLSLGLVRPSAIDDIAPHCLICAFITAPVAFVAAVLLLVANNHSLTVATYIIGGCGIICTFNLVSASSIMTAEIETRVLHTSTLEIVTSTLEIVIVGLSNPLLLAAVYVSPHLLRLLENLPPVFRHLFDELQHSMEKHYRKPKIILRTTRAID